MFKRATKVVKDRKQKEGCFEMQFVVYRNYNVDDKNIIDASTWAKKPDDLRAFMEKT